MVAQISTSANIYGALKYNLNKVDEGKASVLATNLLREPPLGTYSVVDVAEDMQRWVSPQCRIEKPYIHISLNPDPKDVVSDDILVDIASKYMEHMGWGEQPYIIFKHTDIERAHIHIVSLQVTPDGRKINDSHRNRRSVAITEQLELEYGLHPARQHKSSIKWTPNTVDYTRGDVKAQIASIVKAMAKYSFQSLGEFKALLALYNVGIEEVRGVQNNIPYRGLVYTALMDNGDKAPVSPIKASLISRKVGIEALESHMRRSHDAIASKREMIRKRIDKALLAMTNEESLRESLRHENIELYLKRNAEGRIVGVTFIDNLSRCVVNGSRLGKAYSANAFETRLKEGNINITQSNKQSKNKALKL